MELPILEGVVPVFADDYWNGPLRGMCKYKSEDLFFSLLSDRDSDEYPVRFGVYRLPKAQTEYFIQSRNDFERLVGTHFSYAEDELFRALGPQFSENTHPDWRDFYKLPRPFNLEEELKKDIAELLGSFLWWAYQGKQPTSDAKGSENAE